MISSPLLSRRFLNFYFALWFVCICIASCKYIAFLLHMPSTWFGTRFWLLLGLLLIALCTCCCTWLNTFTFDGLTWCFYGSPELVLTWSCWWCCFSFGLWPLHCSPTPTHKLDGDDVVVALMWLPLFLDTRVALLLYFHHAWLLLFMTLDFYICNGMLLAWYNHAHVLFFSMLATKWQTF